MFFEIRHFTNDQGQQIMSRQQVNADGCLMGDPPIYFAQNQCAVPAPGGGQELVPFTADALGEDLAESFENMPLAMQAAANKAAQDKMRHDSQKLLLAQVMPQVNGNGRLAIR